MGSTILVVAEISCGKLHPMTLEALAAAQHLHGRRLVVVVPGQDTNRYVDQLRGIAADEILLLEDPLLERYTPDAYSFALSRVIAETEPELVFFPNTYQVRDYAPKLAVRFRRSLVSDCIAIDTVEPGPVFIRQVFQGRANTRIGLLGSSPHFVSIQSGAFDGATSDATGDAVVREVSANLSKEQIRTRPEEITRQIRHAAGLAQADVIVAVGRGVKSPEQVSQAARLAELLHGELAASRPLCDEGWVPMERQVGSSGQTVKPRLYLALGISGAIQHIIGMNGSGTIIAINKDPNAPIFKISDIGVVADLSELLPLLITALEKPDES